VPPGVKRTGSRKTVTAANLARLGAERLAEILMSAAEEDAALKRRLRMELAVEVGPEDLAAEISKRLAAIEARRSRVHWRKYKAFVRELDLLRRMIVGPLAERAPDVGLELLWRYLDLGQALFDRVDDARGAVAGVLVQAAAALGPLVERADPRPPQDLARRLADLLEGDDEQLFGEAAAAVASVLDPPALAVLREGLEAAQAARRRGSPSLRQALQRIADLQGDVESYAATLSEAERRQPSGGAEIGRRLLAAGRTEEALAALARSAPPPTARTLLPGVREWEDAYLAALEMDGQADLAQELRWAAFERRLDGERLRAYLRRLPDFDDVDAEERAFAHARRFPRFLQALVFFTAWPAAGELAQLVLQRVEEISPDQPDALEAAVRVLETRHPLPASLLLRVMIGDALRWGRAERAKDAQRQLAELAGLAAQVPDWGGFETHEAFLARMARLRRI
jgi:hypothetical protein